MDATLATLLDEITPSLRALVDRAIAEKEKEPHGRAASDAAGAVLVAVGFRLYERTVPLPSELTDEQRRAFEIVARAELPAYHTPLHGDARAILRWLGVAPPTPLEETVEHAGRTVPLWWALAEIDRALEARRGQATAADYHASLRAKIALLDAMPHERALRAIDCLLSFATRAYAMGPQSFFWGGEHGAPAAVVGGLKGEGADWACDQLDAWASKSADGRGATLENERALLWLFAIVRAGRPIEPRWDGAFVYAIPHLAPPSMFAECALALPEERRQRAAVAAMQARGRGLPGHKLAAGLALLAAYDSAPIAAAMIDAVKDGLRPSALEQALGAIASTRPGVRRALTDWQATLAKPRALKVKARVHPIDEPALSPEHAAQLAALRKSDPDDFGDPERIGDLELRTILDGEGQHVFDFWLWASDSGAVFAAGTTRQIAHRVQGHVELSASETPDASLLAGLRAVLEAKLPKPTAAKAKPKKTAPAPTAAKAKPKKAAPKPRKR